MPGDNLQATFRLGAQRQALQALVPCDSLSQSFEHGLWHRTRVHVLLAQCRGWDLPEFQAVPELENLLRLNGRWRLLLLGSGRLAHQVSSGRASSASWPLLLRTYRFGSRLDRRFET